MTFLTIPIADDIWMPIIVALVTTLIIGPLVGLYIKPRIEARQQRLIRDRQQIDEVIFKFQKISLSIHALLESTDKHRTAPSNHNALMLQLAHQSVYELLDALSRLSPLYVQKHHQHISSTTLFLGFLLGQIAGIRETSDVSPKTITMLKSTASDLSEFDVYFRANVRLVDSQEKIYRRWFWFLFERGSTKTRVNEVLQRYKLSK